MDTWDYIVVGAGSAGCVVARRLSDDPSVRVLVLEAGPASTGFWHGVPAGMAMLIGSDRFDWRYMTEAVPALNGRRISWPRGKGLGGSSAINGMVYTRGNRRDYDHWASMGNPGWAWNDLLPIFRRMEDNERGPNELRGTEGPLKVSDPRPNSRAANAFIEAAHQCGTPRVHDLSVAGEEGTGLLQATIHNGVRQSAYDAYLAPVRHRKNLTILTNVHVTRVVMKERIAVGVEIVEAREVRTIGASREVILSAGALNSPHLLMLSGIGDGDHLTRHGIEPRLHSPGVGKNLQDHYGCHVKVLTKPGWSYNHHLLGWRKYREGLRYLLTKGGYLAASATLAAAFVRSSSREEYADLEIGFRPMTFTQAENGDLTVERRSAISANVYRVRPASRGEVMLCSADPMIAPAFHPNFMSSAEDQEATLAGLRHIRKIFSTQPLASAVVYELNPGPGVSSDDQLIDYLLKHGKSSYHPVGTCKMGADPMAVVDSRLRVRGIRNLRVVDASIMPTPSSGNTNAATIMIGERGADFITADAQSLS